MLSYLETPPNGILRILQLFFGATTIVLLSCKAFFLLLSAKKKNWRLSPGTATGVDAAEKGDTRRLLLEKVPYDLQKRAILHKASTKYY